MVHLGEASKLPVRKRRKKTTQNIEGKIESTASTANMMWHVTTHQCCSLSFCSFKFHFTSIKSIKYAQTLEIERTQHVSSPLIYKCTHSWHVDTFNILQFTYSIHLTLILILRHHLLLLLIHFHVAFLKTNIKIGTFSRTPRSKRDADGNANKGGVDSELGSGDDDYYYDDEDE